MFTKTKGAIVAATLALGVSGAASAAPLFTIDPSALGGSATHRISDQISFESSTLLTTSSATTGYGEGWLNFTAFAGVSSLASGLGQAYNMWATFDYNVTLLSGTFGAFESVLQIDSLAFNVFAIQIQGNEDYSPSFVQANAGSATAPAVTIPGANPNAIQDIGGGSLIAVPGLENEITVTSGGGAALNAVTNFALSAFGSTFFIDPDPFYNMAFNSVTNDAQAFTSGAGGTNGIFAIQGAGTVTFSEAPTTVPEPAAIALFGVGLLGMGLGIVRRRKTS